MSTVLSTPVGGSPPPDCGLTGADGSDALLSPPDVVVVTVNVYSRPLVSPSTTHSVVG